MELEQVRYTISVFTENKIGLMHRIVTIFTRRKINIESLAVSETENHGISRFTITAFVAPDRIGQIVKQIEKQVEVLKAFYYDDSKIVYQELALYKMPRQAFVGSDIVEKIIRQNHAWVLAIEDEFVVIEKTGHEEETQQLFEELKPYGILSFVRSGRVAIAKPMKRVMTHLKELEEMAVN
jgi:acetolactate synthase I/III small subunit